MRLRRVFSSKLASEWTIDNGIFRWTVIVPPNTTTTVHLPAKRGQKITLIGQAVKGAVHEIAAGTYQFFVS
jgi:hypothetical protein